MAHPLDDSRLLVARARNQFDELNGEIRQFWQDHPVEILYKLDPKTREQEFKIAQTPQLPRRWGVLVGEMTGNCVTALNYVVIALIREWDGTDDRDSAFPISDTEKDYLKLGKGGKTYRNRLLNGVPDAARERVDQFQPWKRQHPLLDSLSILKLLRDAAEHRELQAAHLVLQLPTHTFRFIGRHPYQNVAITVGQNGDVDFRANIKAGPKMDLGQGFDWSPRPVPVKIPPILQATFGSTRHNRFADLREIKEVIRWVGVTVEAFKSEFPPAHGTTSSE